MSFPLNPPSLPIPSLALCIRSPPLLSLSLHPSHFIRSLSVIFQDSKGMALIWALLSSLLLHSNADDIHLTTNAQGYLTVIQGFATQLQCVLNTCSSNVLWYKDDILIFNGTQFVNGTPFNQDSFLLQHKIDVDHAKECSGSCSDSSSSCSTGSTCQDNVCCPCLKEDFTLVLRNLSFEDSGRYRCQYGKESELLEFQVEVLESGLKGGFHENISYDHSQCCEEKGISPLCRSMCKPSDMAEHYFDPTSCKTDDYKNFLSCATDGGKRSHVHCCKTQLVPSFCYDLCSADFTMLRRSHRLCLYYLPEIFECYNRAYLPFPDPPEDVTVNAVDSDKLQVCWTPPKPQKSNADYPVIDYTLFYKQIPSFPFLGGGDEGFPLLSSDYGDALGDADYSETPGESIEKRRRRAIDELEERGIEVEEGSQGVGRTKRQTWVFVTRDETTNSSSVREFTFSTLNTTDTCLTITDLRSATRYIVYVTARNGYGTSVPSVRSIASTNAHVISSNVTIPDVMKCCNDSGVSSYCSSKMCVVDSDPSSFNIISIATTCRHEWPKVSPCVADGRNHTECCLRKGVQNDCINICSGSPESLGVHSVLCLNLDLAAIYQCLREGYASHPSPPINVRVHSLTTTSATIMWDPPATNKELVESYTLFIRKNEHGAPIRTIKNAISPHEEDDLDPDSSYAISIQSHSANGTSLPSTTILFQTLSDVEKVCTHGEPLYMQSGKPFLCGLPSNPCPIHFTCTSTENDDEAFCCPNAPSTSFESCCRKMGVSDECLSTCWHNSTSFPEKCSSNLNEWLRCASEGHDVSRCCDEEEVRRECMTACRHPFTVEQSCMDETTKLSTCYASLHSSIPSVRNVEVTDLTSTSVSLTWDHTRGSLVYEVQLFSGGSVVNRTNTSLPSVSFTSLTPSTEYATRVIAYNDLASSPPSFNLTFSTPSQTDADGLAAPKRVRIVWNRGSQVNISWEGVTGKDGSSPNYTLFFIDSENAGQWQTIRTNRTWAVMGELRPDALYTVYVTAEGEGGTSKSSSVLTLIAQPDSFGLPEPLIVVSPERANGVYSLGESLTVNCSVDPKRLVDERLNLDLTARNDVKANEPGEAFVVMEVKAEKDLDTLTCSVTSSDGRQNVALQHLLIKFGPSVHMEREQVRAFDDLSAEITCIVEGFPLPTVSFEYKGMPVHSEIRVRTKSPHTYAHTLVIANVTGREGWYTCRATREGNEADAKAELVVSTALLPVNPRLVLDCCEKENIEGDCLMACTIGEVPPNLNCSQHAPALLKCAIDIRDHSDCCSEKGVSSRCIPLCSGDSFSADVDCSEYAVPIMSCFIRGHESAPTAPTNIQYQDLEDGKIRLSWEESSAHDSYVFYAIYYKKADDESEDYKIIKTRDTSIDIDVPSTSLDIAVVAANAYGHSPLSFFQLPSSQERKSSSSSGLAFFFLVVLVAAIAIGVFYVVRRVSNKGVAFPFTNRNHGVPMSDPSVAFENPGFGNDLGDEVEIRGLGSVAASNWQQSELQSGSNESSEQNGMRYSKLRV